MSTDRSIPSIAEAMALHRAGRLGEAQSIYRQILEAFPDNFESLHLLGVICGQRGHHAQAIRYDLSPFFHPAISRVPGSLH
jgi:Flp pilus assembly protein TadD